MPSCDAEAPDKGTETSSDKLRTSARESRELAPSGQRGGTLVLSRRNGGTCVLLASSSGGQIGSAGTRGAVTRTSDHSCCKRTVRRERCNSPVVFFLEKKGGRHLSSRRYVEFSVGEVNPEPQAAVLVGFNYD